MCRPTGALYLHGFPCSLAWWWRQQNILSNVFGVRLTIPYPLRTKHFSTWENGRVRSEGHRDSMAHLIRDLSFVKIRLLGFSHVVSMKGTAKCIKSPNNIREKKHTKVEITPVPYSGGQGVPLRNPYITRHRRRAARQAHFTSMASLFSWLGKRKITKYSLFWHPSVVTSAFIAVLISWTLLFFPAVSQILS